MRQLKLEFSIHGKDRFPKVSAQVVLEPYTESVKTSMPAATRDCDVMHEFESELRDLENQIARIRKQAKKQFVAAGVMV